MSQYEWDYRTMDCSECFQARGKMCHDVDNESMIKATGSSSPAHEVCCKPKYFGDHCEADWKHRCSPPSFDNDKKSKWANVVDPETYINQ